MRFISLDISASSTGWAFTNDGKEFEFGTIVTKAKDTRSEGKDCYREGNTGGDRRPGRYCANR